MASNSWLIWLLIWILSSIAERIFAIFLCSSKSGIKKSEIFKAFSFTLFRPEVPSIRLIACFLNSGLIDR